MATLLYKFKNPPKNKTKKQIKEEQKEIARTKKGQEKHLEEKEPDDYMDLQGGAGCYNPVDPFPKLPPGSFTTTTPPPPVPPPLRPTPPPPPPPPPTQKHNTTLEKPCQLLLLLLPPLQVQKFTKKIKKINQKKDRKKTARTRPRPKAAEEERERKGT